MDWLVFALLAPILMTVVNFGDKFVVEKHAPDYRATMIYFAIINGVVAVVFWTLNGFTVIDPPIDILLLMLTGGLTVVGGIFYLQAIGDEDMSTIIVLVQLNPAFTLIMAVLFRDETLTIAQTAGFLLILIASIGVTLERTRRKNDQAAAPRFRISTALGLMVLASLVWAVTNIFFDMASAQVVDLRSLILVTGYVSGGYFIAGLILYLFYPGMRQIFNAHVVSQGRHTLRSVAVVELTFIVRQLFFFMAISLGPVSLVSVIGSTQVFFGILLGWLLTLVMPNTFSEDISRANLLRKAAWAVVLFMGLLLVR